MGEAVQTPWIRTQGPPAPASTLRTKTRVQAQAVFISMLAVAWQPNSLPRRSWCPHLPEGYELLKP